MKYAKKSTPLIKKSDTLGYSKADDSNRLCYTMFVTHDNYCFNHVNRYLTKRTKSVLQKLSSCTIILDTKEYIYQGNPVYLLKIEGESKEDILKCRLSLPFGLTKYLITQRSIAEDEEDLTEKQNF